ncbi:MAG: fatty acid desaturase [Methylococcaceae bacterium]
MFSHLKYLSCFIFPSCVVWFLYTGPHDIGMVLAWTMPLWIIIVVDWLGPKINPNQAKHVVSDSYYDAILYALSFLQFLIISLLLIYASQLQWNSINEIFSSIINLVVLRILVGTTSGSSAIIVAHELIHRNKLHLRVLGRLLLFTVCYEHFVIAHIRGHHLSVATPEDIATARLDESFNVYWKRVTIGHFKYAWNFELDRLGLTKTPVYHYKMLANSVLQGLLIEFSIILLILVSFGWVAAFIFLYQALSGVRLLETINYYQHWGLEQGKSGNILAWVNQSSFTEYALVGLSNHIEHHQNATISFHEIPYSEQGPKMPYGYFVTNLWVKLNNDSYRRVCQRILKTTKF